MINQNLMPNLITRLARKTSKFAVRGVILLTTIILTGCSHAKMGIFDPKGLVAVREHQLLFDAIALMLIVVIPVIIMSFAFIYRYRDTHKGGSKYTPNWSHNTLVEIVCWGVPIILTVFLGIMTWKSSHQLDPYRKLDVPGKVMTVEAIALPWKWLFIYPQQGIATVNELVIPKDRQIKFYITADNVPMSAFFIPQLGSQIYAMAGMRTQLHLVSGHIGTYDGLNTQYNGKGFSEMHFKTKVVSAKNMRRWVAKVKRSRTKLFGNAYAQVRKPSIAAPVQYFSAVKKGLFTGIMKSYRAPVHPGTKRAELD